MNLRREFGFNNAYVVPIHGPAGLPAFVSLGGFQMELPPHARPSIHLMAISAFERIREIRFPHISTPVLTPREREVLSWVAQGKRAREIGVILNIAKRTVDEHVHSATRKLGASTMAQAVAIAILDGHIQI